MTLRNFPAGRRIAASRATTHPVPFAGHIEEKAVKTHLLCAVALGLAGIATAATAQDSDTFNINSNVTPFCANTGADPAPLELGELSDGDGFVVTTFAGPTTFTIPGYYCNAPATITLSASPLLETTMPAPSDAGFTNRVDYLASLVWSSVNGSVNSVTNAPVDIPAAGPTIGDLVVSVSAPDTVGNTRPIAGDYEGAVTLTVVVQP